MNQWAEWLIDGLISIGAFEWLGTHALDIILIFVATLIVLRLDSLSEQLARFHYAVASHNTESDKALSSIRYEVERIRHRVDLEASRR